jgi:D-alanyl-D-alanine dipeptidase
MPTAYDAFGPAAHRDFRGAAAEAAANRDRLRRAMEQEGFVGLPEEWWHFDDPDWEAAPVLDIPLR